MLHEQGYRHDVGARTLSALEEERLLQTAYGRRGSEEYLI